VPDLTPLPSNLKALLDRLAQLSPRVVEATRIAGELARQLDMPVYLVGGVVRDLLLGRESVDLDLVVDGDGAAFARGLADRLEVPLRLHPTFMTGELSTPSGCRIDIAAARGETYPQPASLPVVERAALTEDLRRRDFSVNAMAIPLFSRSHRPAELVDLFSGHGDLAAGFLRVLHERSFQDDPTRILRAARFELRLGLRLDLAAEELVAQVVAEAVFDRLSSGRLRQELSLTLASANPSATLDRLAALGVTESLHPALQWGTAEQDRFLRLTRILERSEVEQREGKGRVALLLTAWVWDRPRSVRNDLAERLQLPAGARYLLVEGIGRIAEASHGLLTLGPRNLAPRVVSEKLRHLSGDELLLMHALAEGAGRADAVEPTPAGWAWREIAEMRGLQLTISGRDLLAIGFQPGRELGRTLEEIRGARLDRTITAEEELAMARQIFEQSEERRQE